MAEHDPIGATPSGDRATVALPGDRHELRTLLNQIIGYSELLIEEANDWGHEGLAADLQKIRGAGQRVLQLDEHGRSPGPPTRPADLLTAAAPLGLSGTPSIGAAPAGPGLGPTAVQPTAVQPTAAQPGIAQPGTAQPGTEAEPAPAPQGLPGTLLVVDDDDDNSDMLARRLRNDGHTVHIARSGPEALAHAAAHPFDLILLDLRMPGMDGEEVLKRLKDDVATRGVPVLMLSAVDELDQVVRCIELGAEDYLPKPFSPVLLRARIGASLEKKRRRDEELQALEAQLRQAGAPSADDPRVAPGPALPGQVLDPQTATPPADRHPADARADRSGFTLRRPAEPAEAAPLRVRMDLDPFALIKVGGVLFALWFVSRAWSVVVLVAVSLMLVATLSPLVRRLEARVARRWGIMVVGASVVTAAAVPLMILIPPLVRQGQSLVNHFPQYALAIEGALRKWRVPISLSSMTQDFTQNAAPQLLNVASTVLSGVIEMAMIAVLTIYLLIDGPRVQMALIRLFPRPERLPVRQVLNTIGEQVGSFMRGQLLTSALAGIFSFLLLFFCRIPEPLALAVWMAVADAIPLVGLFVGMVPAVLLALTRDLTTAVIVAAGYVLYHQFETTLLVPRIYGSTMKLSGSAILVSILVGGKLMGVVGALFALPVAAALPVVLRFIAQWRDRQADRDRPHEDEAGRPPPRTSRRLATSGRST